MPGEQLPPVVASLVGEDESFLAMLDRDVAAMRSSAAEIEGILAGLDIGAAFSDSLSGAHFESLNADEIAQGLSEGLGGVGDAIAEDMGSELSRALSAGVSGGEGLAEGLVEGAAGAGDAVADGLKTSLGPAFESAGIDGGQELAQAIVSETSGIGAEVGQNLHSITEEAGSAGVAAGHALADGVTSAVGPAGAAGMEAGAALAAGIAAGAIGARSEAGRIAESIQADLEDALQQAGQASGGALMLGIADGASSAGKTAAGKTAEALQGNLSDALAQAGASSGAAYAEALINEITAVFDASSNQMDAMVQASVSKVMTNVSSGIAAGEPGVAAQAVRAATEVAQEASQAAETALVAGAAPAAESFGETLAEGITETEPEVEAAVMSLGDLFDSLYLRGQGISGELATAMTEAFGDILTGTQNFVGREAALWAEFNEEIDTNGIDSAIQRAQLLAQQLQRDAQTPAANPIEANVSTLGAPLRSVETEASGAEAALGGVGKAAAGAASDAGGMASIMGGPLMTAIFGVTMALPYVEDGVKALAKAFSNNDAALLNTQQLQSAIQTDGDTAGYATAAFTATSEATNGMGSAAAQAGVSLETYTEAAMGNKDAQDTVTAAVLKLNQSQDDQAAASANASGATGKFSMDLQDARQSAEDGAAANNTLTATNKGVIDTMNETAGQIAAAVSHQEQMDAMTRQLALDTQVFNATLDGAYSKMLDQEQQASESSVALLHLGDNQSTLNMQLYTSVNAYNVASQQASGYATVLQSLNGSTNTMLGSEASFTIAVGNLTDAVKTNGTSLDVQNVKGAQNIQMFTQAAGAADQAATAVYQNAAQHENADQAWNTANKYLTQEKDAFEAAAEKAGFNKTQVQELVGELFKIPKNVNTTVTVNTGTAMEHLSQLYGEMSYLEGTGASQLENEVSAIKIGSRHASGGFAPAGELALFGEEGPELGVPKQDMQIIPAAQTRALLSGDTIPTISGSAGAFGGLGAAGGAAGGTVVNVILQVEGSLVHQNDLFDGLQTGALQFQNRNSYGGLVSGH